MISAAEGFIAENSPIILLEHDLRPETVQAGQEISQMISKAGGRINAPIAAVFGDAQRYQGSKLTWPVVGTNGFDPSYNPINNGNIGKNGTYTSRLLQMLTCLFSAARSRIRDRGRPPMR